MIFDLRLQQFRSYTDESFEFDPGVNIVVGANASGKTNLLEAVLVLCRGTSFRVKDIELIQHQSQWARLDGHFETGERIVKIKQNTIAADKQFEIDTKPLRRLSLQKALPVVLFEPNDLQLFIRGPEHRREYLDALLEETKLGFKQTKNHYKRAVAQRNALLKHEYISTEQLFVWNVRISELGAQIVAARTELITAIHTQITDLYGAVAHKKSTVRLEYVSSVAADNYATRLLDKLEASTELDKARKFTAYGPHREDIRFYLNDERVEHTASRGETRTLLLALKIFELKLLEDTREKRPILLLDDVFSELDSSRRRYLVENLQDYQTVITTTDADAVVQHFLDGPKVIALG